MYPSPWVDPQMMNWARCAWGHQLGRVTCRSFQFNEPAYSSKSPAIQCYSPVGATFSTSSSGAALPGSADDAIVQPDSYAIRMALP